MKSIHIANYIQEESIIAQKLVQEVTGLKTGLLDLDMRFRFCPGELTVVAARPSMGKTSFALHVVLNAVLREQVPTVFFSLDCSKKLLLARMASILTEVDSAKIRIGNISAEEEVSINNALNELSNSKLYISDETILTVSDMHKECETIKQMHGLSLIVIDYFQLINHVQSQKSIAQLITDLRHLTSALKIPVLLTSQIGRACESRGDKRPFLSDFHAKYREIVNTADNVIFLYRDSYYSPDTLKLKTCELIIAKNKNSITGTIEVEYSGEYCKFKNLH